MGPFSLTGQPNAMGGREVGGMANMLAAHMELENAGASAHRAESSGTAHASPPSPGLKAVELFEAIHDGRIKAVWIMATNPVVSLPDADRARAALERCEFVVVSDCVAKHRHDRARRTCCCRPPPGARRTARSRTPSAASPASAPSCRCPGEAQPDWWIVCEVAQRMGFARDFAYSARSEIFDEHARLSGSENRGYAGPSISAGSRA